MKDNPLLILLILFVILGFAYKPIKDSGLKKPNSSRDQDSSYSSTYSNTDIKEEIRDIEREVKGLKEEIEEKIEESKRSPYYDKITISGVSGLYNSDPSQEYIYLYTNLDKNESINITGWYLKSEITGYYAKIGKAALLPFPFTKTESNVILTRGDRAILTKGFSPIGISFRTNKCTGFFEENKDFTPSLPFECPRPSDEKLPRFSSIDDRNDECIEIIESIPRCRTRGNQFVRNFEDTVPLSCKQYITTNINYNSCLANHFGDTDFPGNEYRIYLNKFGPLWRKEREKINLYDHNNLIVDSITY